jgi:hypothetical protein
MKKDNVILPNLSYDKSKDSVYFKFKNSFYLTVNNKIVLFDKYLLNNVSYTGKIYYYDVEIKCNILKNENKDGLCVNLEYENSEYLCQSDISKIGKEIESLILNIDNYDDYSNENKYTSESDENDSYSQEKYIKEDLSDNSAIEMDDIDSPFEKDIIGENIHAFSKFNSV